MNDQDNYDRVITSWLADGPSRLPDAALDRIVVDIDRAGSWRLGWLTERRLVNRLVLSFGGVVVLVFAAIGGAYYLGVGDVGSSPSPSPSSMPSPTPSPRPLPGSVPLEPGTYLYEHHAFTIVPFQFTVPDGWVVENGGWTIRKSQPSGEGVGLASATLDMIYADACTGMDGEVVDAGSTVDDLVNALLDQTGPAVAVEGPFDVTLGGYPGQRVDITSPAEADLEGCSVPGLQLWRDDAGSWFVVGPDGQSSIYIVDVDGERVVLMTQYQESSPATDLAELEAVIESIEFEP